MTWRQATLEDLVFFQRGFDITKDQQEPGDVPVVTSSGITSYHSESKVSGPGVVVGRKGTLGSVHYVECNYWPHDTTLWSKTLKGNDPRYVYYFVKTLNLGRYDVGNSNPTLNRNHIHSLPIRIPDPATQKRISAKLANYDYSISNNQRRIELLEQSARLLYREWFVRLKYPGHEHDKIVDGVPDGWQKEPASQICEVLSGGTPKTEVGDYWDGTIPFYTPKDAVPGCWVLDTERHITETGLANCNSRLYSRGTVFISARGTVGKLNLTHCPMAMSQSCYALKSKTYLSQYFLYSSMESAVNLLKQNAVGAVFDAIIVDTFKRIKLVRPPEALARSFDEIVAPMFLQMEALTLQNKKLSEARDLLLPRLMDGRISV